VRVASHHVESLDVFRGATVAAMILVNNPGDWSFVSGPLLHAYWFGCTFADLVFPWFIFIMGVAMPYAFARRRERGGPVTDLHRRIVKRAVILIGLGLLLTVVSAWPAVFPLRLPGVLQRIALSYLCAAFIVLHLDVGGWAIAAAGLLAAHWALLALVPFGGFPGGTITPDHNIARYLDTLVFGRHVLAIPNDPEGLVGTLTAIATALTGALCGEMMRRAGSHGARTLRLLAAGAVCVAAGLLWSRVLPLSKPLWTGSYVLYVTGLGMLVLAVTYLVVDVRGLRAWARPFLWLGVNPLAIYVLSEVGGHLIEKPWVHQARGLTTAKAWVFWRYLVPAVPSWPLERVSLVFGLGYVGLWMLVAGLLYRRRIRIQV
jgi:predicted acyltransferase